MRSASLGLAVLGLLLGLFAVIGFLTRPSDVGDPGALEASLTETTISASPSTIAPEGASTTTVHRPRWDANDSSELSALTEPPYPERLIIDVLGIDAPVGAYGVDSNGQMEVPDNVTEVGWYRHGPSPGEPGSAVLAAHVDLRGPGRGLFYDLADLEEGDEVSVRLSDGTTVEFRVAARSIYLKDELPLDAIFSREGDPVLTLITCGGGFSSSTGHYDSNVVVYATPSDGEPVTDPDAS